MLMLLLSFLMSGATAQATNASCLLQINRSTAGRGVWSHSYCASASVDTNDGLDSDWGELDIKYVYRPESMFDDTRPPGFSGATTSRNVFFMAVAGIGYSVDKVKVKVRCYDQSGNEYAKEKTKTSNIPVGRAGVWKLPTKWSPLGGGTAIYCNYRVKVKALSGEWKKKTITGADYGNDFIAIKMTGTTQNVKLDIKKSPSHVKCADTA